MSTTGVDLDGWSLIGMTPGGGRSRVTGLEGWYERRLRRDRQGKAQQDGAWPSSGSVIERPVTITGQIVYTDPVAAKAEARTMLALGGRGLSVLTVVDSLGPLTAMVEVDAIIVPPVQELIATFSIVLAAPDPLLYGPETFASTTLSSSAGGTGLIFPLIFPLDFGVPPGVTPGAIAVANAGTDTYWPRLRIDGPVTNPTVTLIESGDWIYYDGTVPAGSWLDIDCANRRVLLNGKESMRINVTSSGAWLAIAPGNGSIVWTADTADPAASLSAWSYESAWS